MTQNKRRDQKQKQRHNDDENNPAVGGEVELQQQYQLKEQQRKSECVLYVILLESGCSPLCLGSLTFHASHVSSPGPVLSRCHGGDVVFWVCMHGFTHEGAIHVDRVVTASKAPVCDYILYSCKFNICSNFNK